MTQASEDIDVAVSVKPCPNPWCNSHKAADCDIQAFEAPIVLPSSAGPQKAVACPVCPIQTPWFETEDEAIAAWNRRTQSNDAMGAIDAIAAERRRQIETEGYDPAHDDEHDRDLALPRAASCYALAGTGGNGPFWINPGLVPQQVWPYRWEWKPYDRRRNLVRAGALIVAEIERIDRAALAGGCNG